MGMAGGAGENGFDHPFGELAGSLIVLLHNADPLSRAEATAFGWHVPWVLSSEGSPSPQIPAYDGTFSKGPASGGWE